MRRECGQCGVAVAVLNPVGCCGVCTVCMLVYWFQLSLMSVNADTAMVVGWRPSHALPFAHLSV